MRSGSSPRLDVLLYAHDGRGHGHVSRSIAIGLALRRLAPGARVLLATGAANVAQLEPLGELDWVKLPSRRAVVAPEGISEGQGASNLGGEALTSIRGAMLAALVSASAPRCVLVDHLPLGKESELASALAATASQDCVWLLGLRAVVGEVRGLRSGAAVRAVRERYGEVLWYGDTQLHGSGALTAVEELTGRAALPCGLVSRARELAHRLPALRERRKDPLGTISVPWCGPETAPAMASLARALSAPSREGLEWHAYVGPSRTPADRAEVVRPFERVPGCTTRELGPDYLHSLQRSRVAVVYAGYNSIVDSLWAEVPAVLLCHATEEGEQDEQADLMTRSSSQFVSLRNGAATEARWAELVRRQLRCGPLPAPALDGAERAARHLLARIGA